MHLGKTVMFHLCLKMAISDKRRKVLFCGKEEGFERLPPWVVHTYQISSISRENTGIQRPLMENVARSTKII